MFRVMVVSTFDMSPVSGLLTLHAFMMRPSGAFLSVFACWKQPNIGAKHLGAKLSSCDVVCAGGRCECDRDEPAAGGTAVTHGAGEGNTTGVSAGDH